MLAHEVRRACAEHSSMSNVLLPCQTTLMYVYAQIVEGNSRYACERAITKSRCP